jgi:hypothetical protein
MAPIQIYVICAHLTRSLVICEYKHDDKIGSKVREALKSVIIFNALRYNVNKLSSNPKSWQNNTPQGANWVSTPHDNYSS